MRAPLQRVVRLAGLALVAAVLPAAAQTGSVAGRATDQTSGQPLIGARVQVIGTVITTQTNSEGRYRLNNVPSGDVTLRMVALGYGAQSKVVTVRANEVATADFSMVLTPYSLDEFVVTATGEQSRREVANAVTTVEVSDLARSAPAQTMGDILAARAPSVTVLPGNITGGGSRVRIRGNSSISLSNEPIYVVDGIRIWGDENSSSIGIGGTNPGRVNDINPEDIESIEIVRGPSASTLYGTDAANGVIVIKTKKGKAGPPVWNVYTEQGFQDGGNRWPDAYRGWRAGSTVNNVTQCFLFEVAAGSCVQDSVSRYNLFEDKEATPNGVGHRQQYGAQVSGGTDVVRYYVSGEWEDEEGYLKMPEFARNHLLATKGIAELREEQERPNALTRTSIRANVSAQLGQNLDVALSTGYTSSNQRLPQTDNNTTGLLSNGLGGLGYKNNQVSHGAGLPVRTNYGYRLYTPDEFFSESVVQGIDRTIMSGTANYRPLTWLSLRGVAGVDFASREDSDLCRRDDCVPGTFGIPYLAGFRENNRTTNWIWTGDFSGTANYQPFEDLTGRTTVGTQFSKNRFARNGAFSWDLTPGATTVTAGANPSADEATTESSIWGFFIEQMFGWRDKVFVTAALRTDKNNAFGQNFDRVYYPKLAVSWMLSEESFMSTGSFLTSLRLRAAFGASGRQPGVNDALSYFTPSTASVEGQDTPSLIFSAQGNADLKPERTEELEMGFDASLLNSRLNLEFTYYDKNSKDALLLRNLPPSLGTATGRWENIGKVQNKGIEAVLNAVAIDKPGFGWDITIGGNWGSNEVKDMGEVADIIGSTTITAEGYPIQGWYLPDVGYEDRNGDGLIAQSEIICNQDLPTPTSPVSACPRTFIGYSQPRGEVSLFTGVEMFGRKLRLQANLDSKFGSYQLNGTDRIRCESRRNCYEALDRNAPLWRQARATAIRTSSLFQTGFVEKIDFLRFRELSASYTVPDSWPRLVGAKQAIVTFGVRNAGIITDYTGMDPETGYFSGVTGLQSDFQSGAPPRYYTFRLNVTF